MKNKLSYLIIVGIAFFLACGPSAKEKQKLHEWYVNHQKHQKKWTDSLKIANQKRRDSLTTLSEEKWNNSTGQIVYQKHPEWSKNDCQRIANGEVWIGMDIDMVKYRRGLPSHVNTSNYGSGNKYQWCWDDFNPSCFYGGSDGIVTSYN